MPGLASLRDLVHKERCGLQIPVGIRNMRVTKIGTQRRGVSGYGHRIAGALLKRTNSECMPQVMDARPTLPGFATQSNRTGQLQENP